MKARTKYIRRKHRPPEIEHYYRKRSFLYEEQNGICAVTGKKFTVEGGKIDIMHILDRKEENRDRYPLYIDCVWNLVLGYNGPHINEPKPTEKKRPLHVIDRLERILAENPGIEYEMTAEEALENYGGEE